MSTRLTPSSGFYNRKIAFHPTSALGICVRAETDFILFVWGNAVKSGYQKILYEDLAQIISDEFGTPLVELSRPFLSLLMGKNVVDVNFIDT